MPSRSHKIWEENIVYLLAEIPQLYHNWLHYTPTAMTFTMNEQIKSRPHSSDHDRRVEFALFLKILFKYLEKSKQYLLLQQARLVVMTCTRGQKMRDSSFSPLSDAIEMRLKKLMSDNVWRKAKIYTKIYLTRPRRQRCYSHKKTISSVPRQTAQI